jgi:flagellar hook-associated protein 2
MAITVNSTTPTSGLLTSLGVGSGLPVADLVDKLVAAKKAPQQSQITNQASAATTQLSGLGQVSAALSALQSAMASISDGSAFNAHSVSSSDTDILNVTAADKAVGGSYKIEVTQLASALKASSGAFEKGSTAVGTGTLSITVGDKTMDLSIDAKNNSLAGIRDAINKSGDNPGVTATIVTGSDGAHLVLSGTRTGVENGFTVSSSGGDGGLAALNYDPDASLGNGLSVTHPAADALFTIDGLPAHSAGNSSSAAIDGLTLNFVAEGTSTVTVANDTSKATSALTNLVNTYNSFVGIYQNLTKYDSTSGTAGAMIGDATLNGINNTLARIMGGGVNGTSISSIGISLQVDGKLVIDSKKLQAALADGGQKVDDLFNRANGFSAQLGAQLTTLVGDRGVLAGRTDSISQQLKDLGARQKSLDASMESLTARYQAQFTALDTLMSKLNSTSTYLTQQFDALTNSNKK